MAEWTIISDTVLEPGKPARSVDALAFRDNPIAIAEGAAGAPRVEAISAMSHQGASGAIGTWGLFIQVSGSAKTSGQTEPGSSLRFSAVAVGENSGTPSGTWRCMGYSDPGSATSGSNITIWLRIS